MWILREGVLYGLRVGGEWYVKSSRNSSNLQFFGMFLLVQVEMVYLENPCFVSCCHYIKLKNFQPVDRLIKFRFISYGTLHIFYIKL